MERIMNKAEIQELLKTASNANEAFLIFKKAKLDAREAFDLWDVEKRRRAKEYFRDQHRRRINKAISFLESNGYKVSEEEE